MITVDQYAASVVGKYQINPKENSPEHKAADALIPMLKRWAGARLQGTTLSGAYAKGTAISLSSHVDILLSLGPAEGADVRTVFWQLTEYLAGQNLRPQMRCVSMQVVNNGFRLDLIPMWQASGGQILYHKEPSGPIRTNLGTHMELITRSGRTREICALKIWRERQRLEFPSFYLELMTLRALEKERFGQLAENVFTVLRYLSNHVSHAEVRDPANSGNIVSDDLTLAQKQKIANAARKALEDENLEKMIW